MSSEQNGHILPLLQPKGGKRALLASGSEEDQVRQSILLLLSIRQGERPLMPSFGNRFYEFMFLPNTLYLQKSVQKHVREVIRDQEPRAKEVEVNVSPAESQPTSLQIQLTYRVGENASKNKLNVELDLQGKRGCYVG